jgi:glycosyltransferase involved in cell wall biosynthesis
MANQRALVCALMPEDDRDSGSRRILHLVDGLQHAGWAVTFVSQHANPNPRYVGALQQRGIEVYAGASKWMDQLIATQGYGLIAFGLWDIAEPYVARIRARSPHTRIVVDSIDLHFLRRARQTFQESARPGGVGALDSVYASEMIRELNTYAAADAVLAVSQKEADLINDLTGDSTLAFAVLDGEDLPMSPVPCAERRGMVFIGCFRFAPNVAAVEFLCREILPKVDPDLLARHPVYIVGDGLDEKTRALAAGLPDVRMVGWVPSVAPYLDRARISIVPLLFGAGTKRKVLQALMHGTPTVSTSIGVEGLRLIDERHVLVADDASSFAAAIPRLLTDDELWERLQAEGRAHITAAHGRQAARTQLMTAVTSVLARPPKRAPATASPAASTQPSCSPEEYRQLVGRIHTLVDSTLPSDAGVIVFSKGDESLLKLGRRPARHYPQTASGQYAGSYPSDSEQAIAQLDRLHAEGAEYVLLPATASWWLSHYSGLKEHLERNYDLVLDDAETCRVYGLRSRIDARVGTDAAPAVADDVRLIAFFLPQFHPIPENDRWWGKGFTEWTNVTKARPLFPDHYQPRLPADLGFYDLRMPEVRAAQAELARAYGIHGFCYYHYWFDGQLLLEQPFDEVLRRGEPNLPFCLCWANEPWTRRWDGRAGDILQAQSYSAADDLAHIRWLMPALADPRAITIDGKPVFIVYQSKDLPDPGRTADIWREEVLKAGLPGVYLISCETGWDAGWDATTAGFDAKVQFQPQFAILFGSGTQIDVGSSGKLRVFDYQKAWSALANPAAVSYKRFDTVCPSWDNTARAGERGVVLHGSTPQAYQRWLEHAIQKLAAEPRDHRIVFLNAWNEWAEGCHLEPDQRYGRAYLEATRRALASARRSPAAAASGAAVQGAMAVGS